MNKRERQAAEALRLAAAAEVVPFTDATRFHPRGDYLFCRMKPERMRGRIHLPETAKVQVPIAEVLEVGPDVEKELEPEKRRLKAGQLVLVHLRDVTGIDGELVFVSASKLLALVEPERLVQSA